MKVARRLASEGANEHGEGALARFLVKSLVDMLDPEQKTPPAVKLKVIQELRMMLDGPLTEVEPDEEQDLSVKVVRIEHRDGSAREVIVPLSMPPPKLEAVREKEPAPGH